MSKSLETLLRDRRQGQEAAIKAGYGPTIRADAVKKLVDSVVTWQTIAPIIDEMRQAPGTPRRSATRSRTASAGWRAPRRGGHGSKTQGRRMSTETTVDGGARPVGAAAAQTAVAGSTHPLDEVMLAMDVVDTLRRRERLVKTELDDLGREGDLKERLRESMRLRVSTCRTM